MYEPRHLTRPGRSLRQIEAQLDADRADLASSAGSLRDGLRDGLFNPLARKAETGVAKVRTTLTAHPVLTGLAVAGTAWLVYAQVRGRSDKGSPVVPKEDILRWADDGGPVPEAEDWMIEADKARARVSGLFRTIRRARRNKAAPEADLNRHRSEILTALTTDVRRALQKGLDSATGAARDAALAAREKAYIASIDAARTGTGLARKHPVASVTTVALAGVAAALLVPQSKEEARLLKSATRVGASAGRHLVNAELARAAERAIAFTAARIADFQRSGAEKVAEAPAPSDSNG